MVPEVGVEPTNLSMADFKSAAFAISPLWEGDITLLSVNLFPTILTGFVTEQILKRTSNVDHIFKTPLATHYLFEFHVQGSSFVES
jgi:hypothetical protein